MTDSRAGQHGVVIGIREVYEQGQETRQMVGDLATQIGELVPLNKRLDAHGATLHEHDARLDKLETWQAVALAQTRPRAPWYAVIGGIVSVISGVGLMIALLVTLTRVGTLLG